MFKMKKERLQILNGIKNITTSQRPCNMPLLLECRTFGSLPYVFPWEFSNTAKLFTLQKYYVHILSF